MVEIKQEVLKLSKEKRQQLSKQITRILMEEWGGPKNLLAQNYYQQVVIPDLLKSIELNLHALRSPVFIKIFAYKLNMDFGFPPTFAQGLATDILAAAHEMLPVQAPVDTFEPWERLFRMLAIGKPPHVIAELTGFSQEYVELVQQQYRHFLKVAKEMGEKSYEVYAESELREYDEQLLQFMYYFWRRFTDPHYLERLKAEDIAFELGVTLQPEEILSSFVVIHDFEGQVTKKELVDLLKTGSTGKDGKLEFFTGNWLMKTYSHQDIGFFLEQLIKHDYLTLGHNGKVYLATKTAQLVGELLAPRLVTSVLENIVPGSKNLSEAVRVLDGLNIHVLAKVIECLSRTGSPEVVGVLQQLSQKNNKKIYLQILQACGKIGSPNAINFVIEAMQHRDAMIRARACWALGMIGDSSGYFALMRCLDDKIAAVKEQALLAIGKIGFRGALKKVKEIADNFEEDIHVRHVAREVIEKIKAREGKETYD
ncbi:MAG: HEAT repeat domain-containing protein [Thermoanaerobacteraceae bacterium]|nr:HEAT repeat domain-containing protein [Thermoanaerobacteraceae bacterium]